MTRGLGTRAVVPALVALLTALLVAAPTAQAQFGGLIKRAVAGKAAEKVADKVGPKAPPAAGEAFSATTLQQVIAGARATNAVMQHEADLQQRRDAEQTQLGTLQRQNDGTRNAYAQANQKILSCREASFNDSEHKRQEQMKAHMTADPQNMARMQMIAMKYGKAISDAQQRGDTAALAKAQLDMQREMMGTDVFAAAKADTAAADAKCGKLPKKPAALAAEDQKRATVAALDDSIRTAEAQAVTAGASASGMDKVRYLELRERLASIMSAIGGARLSVSYSDEEMDLVKQHQAELDPLRRAIGAPLRETRAR
jgi:hypothetical protein